nr:RNA-directed DNA polymerase, eukaryota, reverse transcriptase zinc-binding domain protein [Tanacetum cinerariifolium]
MFKRFIWNAGDSTKAKAMVTQKVVCRPKDHGGCGIKSLKKRNEVLLIKQSIWDVSVEKSDSWGWKSMLLIRDDIRNHVRYDIRDGRKVSMWYDKWCKDGPLSTIISRRDIYDARLDDNARVADMVNNNNWVWPDGWKERYAILRNLDGDVMLSNKKDKVLWVTNAGEKVDFNTRQAWEDLRVN